ncbi:MAG: phospholipid carrier-dependent glycosyltransferase, partial [Armatimonadota bacterium]
FFCVYCGTAATLAAGLVGLTVGEQLLFGSLLGFAALSVSTFLLAALHGLYPWVLCTGFSVAGLSLAMTVRSEGTLLPRWRQWWDHGRGARPAQQCALALLAAAVMLGTAGAMAPGTDNDTLLYHLGAPSMYVQNHGLVYVPHNLWTNIPLFAEMLYTAGLSVVNQTLARLFVPCSYVLLLIGCWCFCRRHLPNASPWVPALLVGSIPLLAILNSTSLNDPMLLAYELGALYAFVNFWRAAASRERRGWLIVCAIACGGAAAIKYIGWLPAVALLPAAIWRMAALERWRGALTPLAIGMAVMLLPSLWLAKNLVYTGNPVYPLAYSVFGGRNWSAELAAEYQAHMMSFGLRDEGLLGALKAPFVLVLDEERFGSKLGIGPLFLLLTPLALWAVRRASRLGRFLFGYALLHYAAWLVGPQATRYILPGLLAWSFVIAESVAHVPGRPQHTRGRRSRAVGARALVRGIICAGAALNLGWFAVAQQTLLHPFDAIYGLESRRAYLQQEVPYYST